MVSIPKFVGVLSCGALLCLGLSNASQAGNAASAADEINADQSDRRQGGQVTGEKQMTDRVEGSDVKGSKTIKGVVLRVEDGNYFVKEKDGREVRLHTDQTTQRMENINQGDWIEAKVNNQNHALSIHPIGGNEASVGNETRHGRSGVQ